MSDRVILFHPIGFEYPEEKLRYKGITHLAGLPLGSMAVSSIIDKSGYKIHIISGAEKNYLEKIKKLAGKGVLFLGISCMTGYQITQGLLVAKSVRKIQPGIKLIWGGFHPSILPGQTIKSDLVDIVVRGYGERTLYELAETIRNGRSLRGIKGITYFEDGQVVHNEDRPYEDINNFPDMPYHLVNVEEFITPELGKKTLGYITSRGCPNNCSFCADRVVYKRKWNALHINRVLEDLSTLKSRYGIDSVRIMDSNFFVSEKRVVEFCEGIIGRGLDLKWGRVNGSAEILVKYSENTWKLLKAAGCHSIAVGIESGYDVALKRINKPASVDDIYRLKDLMYEYDIYILGAFMLGIPVDLNSFENQRKEFYKEVTKTLSLINYLMKNRRDDDRINLFKCTPYPGTVLYEECQKIGWKPPNSLSEWEKNTLFDAELSWLMPEETELINVLIEQSYVAYPPKAKGLEKN